MTGLDVLKRELALPLEWQLGVGGLVRFAPPRPTHLELPGFRDPGSYRGRAIDPVFALSVLDREGRPLDVRAHERNWNPARLELKYRLPHALITERRTLLPIDAFISQWTMSHADAVSRQFWLVLWTRRPAGGQLADIEANPQGISFQETGADGERWGCALGASFDADSWSVSGVSSATGPLAWETSPFFDLMTPGGLPGHFPTGEPGPGPVYFALCYPFEIAPGEKLVLNFAAAFAPEAEQARANLEQCICLVDPIQQSEEEWINWFEDAPMLTCSNPHIQRAYWHRWAMRKIWATPLDDIEGTDAISTPGALAATIDNAWRQSSEEATAEWRLLATQADESLASLPVALAARRLLSIHPDAELRQELAARLAKLAVAGGSPSAARQGPLPEPWSELGLAPSLERTVHALDLAELLGWLIEEEGEVDWRAIARSLMATLDANFWDDRRGGYLQPLGAEKTAARVMTAATFLPLLSPKVGDARRIALFETLCDPNRFWTRFPIPTLSRDEADFNADGQWRNQRLDRPHHGRNWPAITSAAIDALGRGIETAEPMERAILADLIGRVIDRGFAEGDLDRPLVAEHFHPLTGRPAYYVGQDQSPCDWLIDHLIRYVCGVRPDETGRVIIDPLPARVEWFSLKHVAIGEHELEIEWDHRGGLTVRVDDEPAGHAAVGQAISLTLPDHWALDPSGAPAGPFV